MKRSILIEKHINPSEVATDILNYNTYSYESWFNKYGDLHSILDQPSEVYYFNNQVMSQYWYKKGNIHRDNDKPAFIRYEKEIIKEIWLCKNGIITKEMYF